MRHSWISFKNSYSTLLFMHCDRCFVETVLLWAVEGRPSCCSYLINFLPSWNASYHIKAHADYITYSPNASWNVLNVSITDFFKWQHIFVVYCCSKCTFISLYRQQQTQLYIAMGSLVVWQETSTKWKQLSKVHLGGTNGRGAHWRWNKTHTKFI